MNTDKTKFWTIWNEIANRVPAQTRRDKDAALAGAWEMYRTLEERKEKAEQDESGTLRAG